MNETEVWCYGCSKRLPTDAFYSRKNGKPVLPCRECKILVGAKRYEEKKDTIVFNQSYLTKKAIIDEVTLPLKNKGCVDCFQVYIPEAMDFDHVRGEKSHSIANLAKFRTSNEEMLRLLEQELELCEVCCSNCHRKRTISRYRYSARRTYLENPLSESLNIKSLYAYEHLIKSGCTDCFSTDLMILEFDHVKDIKLESIGKMLTQPRYPLEMVQDEIAKCEVRCIVCHRIKTAKRNNGMETTEQIFIRKTGRLRCSCGNTKDVTAISCINCYTDTKFDASKYPPLEEIIIGVETFGWLPYSKTLNVSDNGLRKIARKLGADPLPRKKR